MKLWQLQFASCDNLDLDIHLSVVWEGGKSESIYKNDDQT